MRKCDFFSAYVSACWRVEGEVDLGEIASAKFSQDLVILHGREQLLTEQAFFHNRRAGPFKYPKLKLENPIINIAWANTGNIF